MVSFYCHTCKRKVTSKKKSRLSAIRSHYWRFHRARMLKGVKRGMGRKKPRLRKTSPTYVLPDGSAYFTATIETKKKGGDRVVCKKWGKIGAPHSAKRKRWLAHLRRKKRR